MREILFRGKRTDNGEWIEWTLLGALLANPLNIEVDFETVSTYTGINDINGNRIFEGDILESRISENPEDWKIWTVGFEDGTYSFESKRNSVKSRRKYRHEINMICNDEVKFYGLVLIGNIHDNPELLNNE